MAFLGMNFKGKKQETTNTTPVENTYGKGMAFSTPFGKIGKGNLSLPYINSKYSTFDYVPFGIDNLYPQLLNQMYYTSAIHGSIIEFVTNTVIGAGYEIGENLNPVKTIDVKTFEKLNKFKKMSRLLTRDFKIHSRVTVRIRRKGGITYLHRFDPATIRNNEDNTLFTFNSDWSRGNVEGVKYNKYNDSTIDGEWLYTYQEDTPGQDIYPIPQYNSILNYGFLDGEIPFLQKANIQNSVFPSAVIRRPKEFSSIDEVTQFKEEISSKEGAEFTGRLMVLTGNGIDDTPEYIPVTANQNDKLFENISKDLRDSIAIAHGINPVIMGVPTAGSLGNSEELKTSYTIYEKNVVLPLREIMEEIFQDLLQASGINEPITINNFQIVDNEIVEKKEDEI